MKPSEHIVACAGVVFYPSSSTSPVQLSSYASGGVLSKISAVLLPGPPASITSAQASLLTTPELCNLAHDKLSRLVLQLHNGMGPTANSMLSLYRETCVRRSAPRETDANCGTVCRLLMHVRVLYKCIIHKYMLYKCILRV